MEIVGNPNKTKDDVSAIYHRLVESFEWSKSESEDDDDGSENMGRGKRLSRYKLLRFKGSLTYFFIDKWLCLRS